MLRTSFIRAATVGFVFLLMSICLTAYSQTMITGLSTSYTISEATTDRDIASFTVSPTDVRTTVSGDGVELKAGSAPGSWILAFTSLPNFETSQSHSFTVTANSVTVTGTITITDVNEPPTFTSPPSLSITAVPENSVPTATYTFAAEDEDTDATLTWSIEGADTSHFSISDDTLTFSPTGELDYEAKSSYSVTVKVSDGTNAIMRSITVPIGNLDEAGTVTLSPSGSVVAGGTVTATLSDPDSTNLGTVTWSWTGDGTSVDSGTSSTYTTVDADAEAGTLSATATYFDGVGLTADQVSSATITVLTVTNVDPEITGTASQTIAEDASATDGKHSAGSFTAVDSDGEEAELMWSVGNTAQFSITEPKGGSTALSLTVAELDYETTPAYSTTLTVTDVRGGTDSITVNVTITDVDEPGTLTVTPAGVVAGGSFSASVTDPDSTNLNQSWEWTNAVNAIVSRTSSYTTTTEDIGMFTVEVNYYDGHSLKTLTKSVVVLEAANQPPTITGSESGSVAENASASIGGTYTADDPDGVNANIMWSVSDMDSFSIISQDGENATLSAIADKLNHETAASVSVTVTATDEFGDSASITVIVDVTDVEEDGEVMLSTAGPVGVGQTITATLTDPDSTKLGIVTWLWSGAGSSVDSGASSTYTTVEADDTNSVTATARYFDGTGGSVDTVTSAEVAVDATAVTDSPGTVTLMPASDVQAGTPVTATLTDPDSAMPTNVQYQWNIGGATGMTYTPTNADVGMTLSVTVSYDDGVGSTDTATGSVGAILAKSPPPPTPPTPPTPTTPTQPDPEPEPRNPGVVTLTPSTVSVGTVVTATLNDADGGVTGMVWSWQRSSNGTYVTISGATTNQYTATEDDAGKRLRATVTYSDRIGAGNTATSAASGVVLGTQNPDLVVDQPTASKSTLNIGEEFTLSVTVRNAGSSQAAATTLRYYRSTNATITTGDTQVGSDSVHALEANGTSAKSIALNAPTAAGTYYYGACVDSVSDESGTTNNCSAAVSITVAQKPDLIVSPPTVSKNTLVSGEDFTLSATIRNEGAGRAAAAALRYYRSTNATITTSDTEVGSDSVDALEANGTSAESIALNAPTAAGTYYYGACVDSVSNESDKTNNCSEGVSITVEAKGPTLHVSTSTPLTEDMLDGSQVTLTLEDGTFEQSLSTIRNAVEISGIAGVSVGTVTRVSDTKVAIVLAFDGTDFETDATLTLSVGVGAIANYSDSSLTANLPVTVIIELQPLAIYWIDRGTDSIRGASLDGSRNEGIVTRGLETPRGLALDVAGGQMYWTQWGAKKIQRANLDGSIVEDLVTQGLEMPRDIAVAGSKMYWTDSGVHKIQRADLDGSNVEDLVTQELHVPNGLALDTVAGKMYWIDSGADKIQRANLDGSNVEDLVTQGLDFPIDIALDVTGGKMYWTDVTAGKIQRANLDGSNVENIVTGLRAPHSIALDVANLTMYWTDWRAKKIQRANLNGSGVEDVVTSGIDSPSAIAIGSSSVQPPVATTDPVDEKDDEETAYQAEDVNRDGTVDVQDLAYIAQHYSQTGQSNADVNGDEIVNVVDLLLVAAALADNMSAAPAARAQLPNDITAATIQQWLTEAKLTGKITLVYQRGILVLEQLLAALTPEATALLPNYPNPFNPETWIPYKLAIACRAQISIYDTNGVLVRQLDLGYQRAGYYTHRSRAAYWDGRNDVGERVATGVYFYRLQTAQTGYVPVLRKMVILK